MRDSTDNTLQSIFLTQEEREEWKDVIKMNDYLTKGRRPQFWEENYVKRVLGEFLWMARIYQCIYEGWIIVL